MWDFNQIDKLEFVEHPGSAAPQCRYKGEVTSRSTAYHAVWRYPIIFVFPEIRSDGNDYRRIPTILLPNTSDGAMRRATQLHKSLFSAIPYFSVKIRIKSSQKQPCSPKGLHGCRRFLPSFYGRTCSKQKSSKRAGSSASLLNTKHRLWVPWVFSRRQSKVLNTSKPPVFSALTQPST